MMDAERWPQVEAIFMGACRLPAGERKSYVEQRCREDPELLAEVESLLTSHSSAGDHLDRIVREARLRAAREAQPLEADSGVWSEELVTRPTELVEGKRFGAYEVIELIGSGGMGAVYAARRSDKVFQKRVALKVIKGNSPSKESLRRFVRERQALAYLDHPHIARLFDGGTSEDGLPYIVMEYIEGQPIDRWSDTHCLPIGERLRMFRKVCSAVQHAHQHLIVHRDLKPGNIFVDSSGQPKLLDFGIAKILETQGTAAATTEKPLTVEYASPEQLQGHTITTRSDIYSLGVVLYQLLAGSLPFQEDTAGSIELIRKTCEVDPSPPSSCITTRSIQAGPLHRPVEQVARDRASSPQQLRRQLSGDLDNIVLRALRKEPGRRYSSVEQFSADLQRFLDGRPVSARTATFLYRSSKFVRRHRAGVLALSLFVLVLAAGIYAVIQEAESARRQAVAYREVGAFILEMYKTFDPYGKDRGMLDREAADLLQQIPDQPLEQLQFMENIAGLWERSHLFDRAVPWREQALKTSRKIFATSAPEMTARKFLLGRCLFQALRFDRSTELLHAALQEYREFGVGYALAASQTEHVLAQLEWAMGDLLTPRERFDRVLAARHANASADPESLMRVLSDYGWFLHDRGDLIEAERLLLEASELATGPDVPPRLAAEIWRRLGMHLWLTPRYREAEYHVRRALRCLHLSPRVGKDDLAYAESQLALAEVLDGRGVGTTFTTSLVREAATKIERRLGPRTPQAAKATLAQARLIVTDVDGVILLRFARSVIAETLDADHLAAGEPALLLGLGALIGLRGFPASYHDSLASIGVPELREAHEILSSRLPATHWKVALAAVLCRLAETRIAQDQPLSQGPILKEPWMEKGLLGSLAPSSVATLQRWIDRFEITRSAKLFRQQSAREQGTGPTWVHSFYGTHARVPTEHRPIDYDDDFVEKSIQIDSGLQGASHARLWVFAQAYHCSEPFREEASFHIMVNGDCESVMSYDLSMIFSYQQSHPYLGTGFLWVPFEIPIEWIKEGTNTFLLYEDLDYASRGAESLPWQYNNLHIGVVADRDFDQSWWHNDVREDLGYPMAQFFSDQLGMTEVRTCVQDMWKDTLATQSAQAIEAARRQAARACRGELMIFLELVP